MKFYVYFLIDPRTGTVFYVGKGSKKWDRFNHHLIEFEEWDKLGRHGKPKGRNLKKIRKIAQIVDGGFEVQVEIAFETNYEHEAHLQEINCIAAFGRENLTNLTDGGEGSVGLKWSEESKQKASIAAKKRPKRVLSEETKKKIRESNKKRYQDPELRNRIRDVHLGKPVSEEQKKKISATLTGSKLSEECKKKIGDAHRGKTQSKEHVQKRVSKIIGRKYSEDHRRKISDSKRGKRLSEEHKKNISRGVREGRENVNS